MEMTDRLLTLPHSEQLRVVEKLFRKLGLAFGNQMLAKWSGMNMQEVYADWAEELQDFTLGAIAHGIPLAKALPHPPSQGEFKDLCRTYRPPVPLMIGKQITPEQLEKNRQKIAELAATLARKQAMQ